MGKIASANPIQDAIDEGNVSKTLRLEATRQAKEINRAGGKAFFNPMSFAMAWQAARKNASDNPKKEDPPIPPLDDGSGGSGSGGDTTTAQSRPKSNSWPDIVAHYFPKGAGTQYKDGGLVRGGGCAAKGRGRGKIV